MTTPTFTLIVSIIVRLGEGGLTEVQPFTMLEACVQRQMSLDARLKGKVAALGSRCEHVPPEARLRSAFGGQAAARDRRAGQAAARDRQAGQRRGRQTPHREAGGTVRFERELPPPQVPAR